MLVEASARLHGSLSSAVRHNLQSGKQLPAFEVVISPPAVVFSWTQRYPQETGEREPLIVSEHVGRGIVLQSTDIPGNMVMSESCETDVLLNQVARRLRIVNFARSLHHWTLGILILCCVTVLTTRLAGLVPRSDERPEWLLIVPFVAALGAWLFHRRVEKTVAARVVDRHASTSDLFLTVATLSSSSGEYQSLVEQAAARAANQIVPAEVVPWQVQRPLGIQAGALGVFALLIWLLPTLDPFGKVEAATSQARKKKEIDVIRQTVRSREEQIRAQIRVSDERETRVGDRLNELMESLRRMQPVAKTQNSEVLQTNRQALNDLWKNLSNEQLRDLLSQSISDQQFGGARNQKLNEWLKQLQQGKSDQLQEALEQAQESMQAMLEAKTPEERAKVASDLKRQLQDLRKFSSERAGSKELENALNNALKSLDALAGRKSGQEGDESGEDEMSAEAAEALRESLELSKKELQELARSVKDMKQLEEALKTLQQAEKLNKAGQLDGEQCEGCSSLQEYAEKYRQMMAGMGTDGQAERDTPGEMMSEDDSDPEGYKDEKSKSQIQAGKVLLSIKTREAATEKDFDPEELRKYESTVSEIKAGVQAAIEAEQIPPGYVDGIRNYFDNIGTSGQSGAEKK